MRIFKPRENKETVCFVFRSHGKLAGTERVILNWCRFIDYKKINIVICTTKGSFWEVFREKAPYVELIDIVSSSAKTDRYHFFSYFIFFRKLKVTKVVWIFNGMNSFSFLSLLAGFIATRGRIYISHHIMPPILGKAKSRLWFGFIRGIGLSRKKVLFLPYVKHVLARNILAVSKDVKRCLEADWRIPANRIFLGGRGVDRNEFYADFTAKESLREEFSLRESERIVVAANRVYKTKRIDRLLGAFLLLLREHPNCYLLIAGDGELKDFYMKRAERNRLLCNRVKFLGFREDVNRLIQGSDLLLLASDKEGQSNVIKEAMACGTIPVATDSPGSKEISDNIFVSKKNVFDFYRTIIFVLSFPEKKLAEIRTRIVYEVKENYDLNECCQRELFIFDLPCRKVANG